MPGLQDNFMKDRRQMVKNVFLYLGKGKHHVKVWFGEGRHDGENMEWWPNGQLMFHGVMINGKEEGEEKWWHPDGSFSDFIYYKDGHKFPPPSALLKDGYIYVLGKYYKDPS
jgi:antitoxin component YwqK of YwqJK toxin-antitoxin module